MKTDLICRGFAGRLRRHVAPLAVLAAFLLGGTSLQIVVSCCHAEHHEEDGGDHHHHIDVELRQFTSGQRRPPAVGPDSSTLTDQHVASERSAAFRCGVDWPAVCLWPHDRTTPPSFLLHSALLI